MILPILSTTTLGNTFEQLAFSLFGSAELFGFAVIIGLMIIMGVSKLPPKFMLMVASFLVIAFKFIYGGIIFNTMTVIILIIYGYLISNLIIRAFSR
jgi:hypothetical protein